MSGHEEHGHRVRRSAAGLAVLLVLAGVTTLLIGVRMQGEPPQPPAWEVAASGAPESNVPASPPQPGQVPTGTTPPLAAALPTRVDIPAIGVASDLLQLGLNPDNTIEVPPLSKDALAGWYRYSPTPGELGPAVILGHVDSAEHGPGVFFDLGALRPGDSITVVRADHTAVVFGVDRVASYPKSQFPTAEVYGNTNHPALRLVTCGGVFDPHTRSYLANIVVYASLTAVHPAGA
jgi:sortase (surface protein transpeptidase)